MPYITIASGGQLIHVVAQKMRSEILRRPAIAFGRSRLLLSREFAQKSQKVASFVRKQVENADRGFWSHWAGEPGVGN
jgi:hypothetical protein